MPYTADPFNVATPPGGAAAGYGDEELRAIKVVLAAWKADVIDSYATTITALQTSITTLQAELTANVPVVGSWHYQGSQSATGAYLTLDGKTIGNMASGADYIHASTYQALYTHLWTNYANDILPILSSGGSADVRGASAAADFAANKRMPLHNALGLSLRGFDKGRGLDTIRLIGTTAIGNNVITAASYGTNVIVAGMGVSGTGIPGGTTITSFGAGTITLSANATAVNTLGELVITGRVFGSTKDDAITEITAVWESKNTNQTTGPSGAVAVRNSYSGYRGTDNFDNNDFVYDFKASRVTDVGNEVDVKNVAAGVWVIKY